LDHLLSKDDLEASRHRREADIGPVPHFDGPAGFPRGFPSLHDRSNSVMPPPGKRSGGAVNHAAPGRVGTFPTRDGPGPLAPRKSGREANPETMFAVEYLDKSSPFRARGAADARAAPPPGRRPAGATTTRATRAIPRGTGPGRRGGVAPPFRSFTIRWLVHTSNVWSWQLESPQNVDPLKEGSLLEAARSVARRRGRPQRTARPTGHAATAPQRAGPRRRVGVVKS
jgi:hypothetical protein